MADKIENEKEPVKDSKETRIVQEVTASSVASGLAGIFLEHNVRKGREIEFPSLGITIGKSNLREANGSNSFDESDDKEQPPEAN